MLRAGPSPFPRFVPLREIHSLFAFLAFFLDRHSLGDVCRGYSSVGLRVYSRAFAVCFCAFCAFSRLFLALHLRKSAFICGSSVFVFIRGSYSRLVLRFLCLFAAIPDLLPSSSFDTIHNV